MTYEHKDVPANKGANHVPYDWTYANAAARTGASGFVSADIGKLALQTDNNTLWMLTATTPTWQQVGLVVASQAQAEAGTDNATAMTPLRVVQALDVLRALASQAEAEAGSDNTKMMTPLRVAQAIAALASGGVKLASFSRVLSAASGTQTVNHNAGFNPSLILFMSAYDSLKGCFGWSDGSINLCFYNQDGTLRGPTTSCILAGLDVSNYQSADVSAKSSSSFTLTWTKYGSPTATFPFYALLIP